MHTISACRAGAARAGDDSTSPAPSAAGTARQRHEGLGALCGCMDAAFSLQPMGERCPKPQGRLRLVAKAVGLPESQAEAAAAAAASAAAVAGDTVYRSRGALEEAMQEEIRAAAAEAEAEEARQRAEADALAAAAQSMAEDAAAALKLEEEAAAREKAEMEAAREAAAHPITMAIVLAACSQCGVMPA
eukprot:SAG25_NODE_3945_length_923_cov_1.531553_1_plen_188_part_01